MWQRGEIARRRGKRTDWVGLWASRCSASKFSAPMAALTVPDSFDACPDRTGDHDPRERRCSQHRPAGMVWQPLPDEQGKGQQTYRSHGGSGCIYSRRQSAAPGAVQSLALFFSLFVFLQQGGGRGENCGEGQEQSAHLRSKLFGDDTGDCGDKAAEKKSNRVFAGLRSAHRCEIEVDFHARLSAATATKRQRPRPPTR